MGTKKSPHLLLPQWGLPVWQGEAGSRVERGSSTLLASFAAPTPLLYKILDPARQRADVCSMIMYEKKERYVDVKFLR